jgi:hypothetical protein
MSGVQPGAAGPIFYAKRAKKPLMNIKISLQKINEQKCMVFNK